LFDFFYSITQFTVHFIFSSGRGGFGVEQVAAQLSIFEYKPLAASGAACTTWHPS
jgi:hypothetical protein